MASCRWSISSALSPILFTSHKTALKGDLKVLKGKKYHQWMASTFSGPMESINDIKVLVLAGATSVGKSAVAMEICHRIKGEIIVADSVQVYKQLNIGSNKPSPRDQEIVPHHLVDISTADAGMTTGDFCRSAAEAIKDIHSRGKVPVVVGGSTMWIQWLVHGMPDAPKASPEAVHRAGELLYEFEADKNWDKAFNVLVNYDPARASNIARNDWYRLRRYLEIAIDLASRSSTSFIGEHNPQHEDGVDHEIATPVSSGTEVRGTEDTNGTQVGKLGLDERGTADGTDKVDEARSRRNSAASTPSTELDGTRVPVLPEHNIDFRTLFLTEDRKQLYQTIDYRCGLMLESGLIEEVFELLMNDVLLPHQPVSKSIGYRQTIAYFCRSDIGDGDAAAFAEFMKDFATSTRNYARRQMNWYRKDHQALFVRIRRRGNETLSDPVPYQIVADEVLHWLDSDQHGFQTALKDQRELTDALTELRGMKQVPLHYDIPSPYHRHALAWLVATGEVRLPQAASLTKRIHAEKSPHLFDSMTIALEATTEHISAGTGNSRAVSTSQENAHHQTPAVGDCHFTTVSTPWFEAINDPELRDYPITGTGSEQVLQHSNFEMHI